MQNDAPEKDAAIAPQAYDAATLEPQWQQAWARARADACDNDTEAYYVLEMFPYPSGELHMGHVRNYTVGDVFARFARLQGKHVLHPMGWDSLGLPAENQAILEKVAPQVRTPKNIARMRAQMQRLGLSYDWDREIASYQPEYYRWNQWFFLQFLKKDLVFRRQSQVNWCPGCQTILANEQVLDDATCWRGHTGVTTRSIAEWAFRTTAYADELLEGLDTLSDWPARITSQQRHWIGKSLGARVHFALQPSPGADATPPSGIDVFTTRLDTIYGCTYVVLAPEHPLAQSIATQAQKPSVEAFIERMRQQDDIERTAEGTTKEGVFTGAYVIHPYTQAKVPVWLANFVLADYGTGAVMSVPAHDTRDFAFAQKYALPIKAVIAPLDGAALPQPLTEPYLGDGRVCDSGPASGQLSAEARSTLCDVAQKEGFGAASTNWHLRDWGFSRQRYWGTPIPIIYCDVDGAVPVPEADLPVVLPDFKDIELTGEGGAPLAKQPSFWQVPCPTCGKPARRETETMDTFVDSAWYFARFLSPNSTTEPFSAEAAKARLPVDIYVGGPEHAVMHLLYFRFWTRAMRDLGLVSIDEPVRRLITQGMVNAPAYRCRKHGYQPAVAHQHQSAEARKCGKCDTPLEVGIEKMSKSKYNGVDPMDLISRYGADTARLYVLFAAPPEKDLEWSAEGVEGLYRFVGRIWRLLCAQQDSLKKPLARPHDAAGLRPQDLATRRATHRTLRRVGEELTTRNHFNTAIAAMMEMVNALHEQRLHEGNQTQHPDGVAAAVAQEALLILAQMLTPFAPHLAECLWSCAGGAGLVVQSRWPLVDASALQEHDVTIALQVQGKLRGNVLVAKDADQAQIEAAARADENVARHLHNMQVVKVIYVPNRLMNFVVRPA
jgi:leucyl-tRNA synthetase